jgi:hypothetical protein
VKPGLSLYDLNGSARLAAKLTEGRASQELNLEELLTTYKGSLCTDPRDKVYSLLGLARRELKPESTKRLPEKWLAVDYSNPHFTYSKLSPGCIMKRPQLQSTPVFVYGGCVQSKKCSVRMVRLSNHKERTWHFHQIPSSLAVIYL